MKPDELLNQYRLALANAGEEIAVRRYAGASAARVVAKEAIVLGRVNGLGAEDIVGDVKLTDRKVILLNDPVAEVPPGKAALSELLPLRSTDTLSFRQREAAIMSIDDDTRRIAGVLIAIEITIRG